MKQETWSSARAHIQGYISFIRNCRCWSIRQSSNFASGNLDPQHSENTPEETFNTWLKTPFSTFVHQMCNSRAITMYSSPQIPDVNEAHRDTQLTSESSAWSWHPSRSSFLVLQSRWYFRQVEEIQIYHFIVGIWFPFTIHYRFYYSWVFGTPYMEDVVVELLLCGIFGSLKLSCRVCSNLFEKVLLSPPRAPLVDWNTSHCVKSQGQYGEPLWILVGTVSTSPHCSNGD